MRVEMKGLGKVKKRLSELPDKATAAASKELKDIVQDLEGESERRAPLDTGELRGSGFSEAEGMEGIVGFTEPYALRQHEELTWRHPKGGEAKYLEKPFKERKDKYIKAIGDAVRRAMEK